MNIGSRRGQVTIKEVAERAGVSQMTVSRVVNGQDLVKGATREKVQSAIRELNYRPNLMARRLAGGNALFIGIVYNNPSPSYLAKVLEGALRACRDLGHHLVIDDMGGKNADIIKPQKIAEHLQRAGLDGVIITPPLSDNRDLADALTELGVANVRVAPGNIFTDTLRVAMDDTAAVQEMAQYLIDEGHERIGFIKAPEDHSAGRLRLTGYRLALDANTIPFDETLIVGGEYTYRSGTEAAFKLLALDPRPTAILAANDDMAAGAIAAANMRGLSVPNDLSVAGFDDTEIASSIWPELTTIRQPIAEMAERAVALLAAAHNKESCERPQNKFLLF